MAQPARHSGQGIVTALPNRHHPNHCRNADFFSSLLEPEVEPAWIGLALFGAIYPGQEEFYSESTHYSYKRVQSTAPEFWKAQFDIHPFTSILNLTQYKVSPFQTQNAFESNHFDIFVVTSVKDLCGYWNSRSLRESANWARDGIGRRTLLMPRQHVREDRIKELLEFVRKKLPHPYLSCNLHMWLRCWDRSLQEQLSSILESCGGTERLKDDTVVRSSVIGVEPAKTESYQDKNLTYAFVGYDLRGMFMEGIGYSDPLVASLNFGRNEIRLTPPKGFRNRIRGLTALDLRCDVWVRYPACSAVSEAIKKGARFTRYGLTVIEDTPDHNFDFQFNLPDEWDTLQHYFTTKGYQIRISKAGQYAHALVNLAGGVSNLPLLASSQAYRVLDMLALRSTKKIAQRIVAELGLQENTNLEKVQRALDEFEIAPELKGKPKTCRSIRDSLPKDQQKGLLGLLSSLSKTQLIKRGFYLECPSCGAPDWYPLDRIREFLDCSGCGHQFVVPVEKPPGSELQWEFRLNTLANRAVDQDVLPPILALHNLTKDRKTFCKTFGLELLQNGQVVKELDLVFLSDRKPWTGECKAGTELEQKDIDTAVLAAKLGFVRFYFCTVHQFSEPAVQMIVQLIERLKLDNSRVEITHLSGKELVGEIL